MKLYRNIITFNFVYCILAVAFPTYIFVQKQSRVCNKYSFLNKFILYCYENVFYLGNKFIVEYQLSIIETN